IGQTTLGWIVNHAYRGGQLAQTVTISGTTSYTDTYVYSQHGMPLELLRTSNGVLARYWYERDGLGNVVALTDVNGNVVDQRGSIHPLGHVRQALGADLPILWPYRLATRQLLLLLVVAYRDPTPSIGFAPFLHAGVSSKPKPPSAL
ncbi:MAG TPA: hypothetical protein VNL35_11710, partial [Chloroflexota bacterium]|nr:hypothetical protein [Chloroflexota bacterium]